MTTALAREEVVAEVVALLERGHNVLLHGPAQIGKSCIVRALPIDLMRRVITIDPFSHVTPRQAAEIRQAMDLRSQQYVAATRSLDRDHLGAVRRIAWRFTTVRVPPLANRVITKIIRQRIAETLDTFEPISDSLVSALAAKCLGRPGIAVAVAESAVALWASKGSWPSANAIYIDARIQQWQAESDALCRQRR